VGAYILRVEGIIAKASADDVLRNRPQARKYVQCAAVIAVQR
jgi:hypothetical protein